MPRLCFDIHDKSWAQHRTDVRITRARTRAKYNYILSGTLRASSGGLFAKTTTIIIVTVIPSGWHRLLGHQVTRPSSTTPYVIWIRFVFFSRPYILFSSNLAQNKTLAITSGNFECIGDAYPKHPAWKTRVR